MLPARPAMRIGLIHWAFPPTTGGVESHVADLARMLSLAGYSVTVITGESSPNRAPEYEIVTTRALNLEWLRSNPGDDDARFRYAFKELKQIICSRRLGLIHGHNLHHFADAPGLALEQLRRELSLRVYHTFHETWPDLLHRNPVYRNWNGNLAVSRFVQQQCHEQLGFRPTLLPLSIDLDRFHCSRLPFTSSAVTTIFHPARLLPWKGVHLSVKMAAHLRLRGYNVNLLLTDTQRIVDWNCELGAYRKTIEELVSRLDLREQVRFCTPCYAEMAALYNEADLVVYPTVGDEPYGLVPLEAMACGRPIVASRSGGIPETVVHSKTGYVVERDDLNSLTDAVAELLGDPQRAQLMGAAGRKHVENNFDAACYVAKLIGRYNENESSQLPSN